MKSPDRSYNRPITRAEYQLLRDLNRLERIFSSMVQGAEQNASLLPLKPHASEILRGGADVRH